jgi:mono/diheme cytochrome c family protein
LTDRSVFGMAGLVLVLAGGASAYLSGAVQASGARAAQDAASPRARPLSAAAGNARSYQPVLTKYCVNCHDDRRKIADLSLQHVDLADVARDAPVLEKVVRKLRSRAMPPAGMPRPDEQTYTALTTALETELDVAWAANPNPGRPAALHRLNRAEYRNAVRDLVALDVDVSSMLPPDAASYGFDNIGDVLGLSPVLLERYLSAARKISRLAVGDLTASPATETYRVPSDLDQDDHIEGLPWGTRGGLLVRHYFPLDAEYIVKMRLARESVVDVISGLAEPHDIEVSLDGERVEVLTVGAELAKGKTAKVAGKDSLLGDEYLRTADERLQLKFRATAGMHALGVAFVKHTAAELETIREPFLRAAPENGDSHGQPYLSSVTLAGPFDATGAGETPSRTAIFECHPRTAREEADCAQRILSTLARHAFRRPVTAAEVQSLLGFYKQGRRAGTFEAGIQLALTRLLVSPSFLFRVETEPANVAPATAYRISDLELASRLSFFLWSSIPDDQLLKLAEERRLSDPAVLEQQVRRMLDDPKSAAFVSNFAGQWLYLRNVQSALPDRRLFPDFNENLRRAFRRETELFFDSILREDRSVLDFLAADYTFVNERLARHYGIPNVYGDRFRRVKLDEGVRGGLLAQGSILTLRSYPNRTSPVLRGVWILENILGAPPPPPPPNVPDLKDKSADGRLLSMREQMGQHRANPACGVCHARMDPIGLAMENFDAVGQWRTRSESLQPIDASGGLPDGTKVAGFEDLRRALLQHSREFVLTLTEKTMIYALGRGVEYYDAPAIRRIANETAANGDRFSTIILGVVKSPPFQMRRSADPGDAAVAVSTAANR